MNKRSTLLAVTAALSFIPVAQAQAPAEVDRISNWAAPLYWQPTGHNAAEVVRRGRIRESAVGRAAAQSPALGMPAVYVAMSPCRVVDTRYPTAPPSGPYGAPAFTAGQVRTFDIPAGPCAGIPTTAVAFSLNIAVVPPAIGTAVRWITAWDASSNTPPNTATLNDRAGLITSNSAVVPAGAGGNINIFATDPTDIVIDINGFYLAAADAANNTDLGVGALASFSTGSTGLNTAVGYNALNHDTTGPNNTAVGSNALVANTTGSTNTAVGSAALPANTSGSANTAVGTGALSHNTTGLNNTAVGDTALGLNTTGNNNTGVGYNSLGSATGSNNFAIGNNAGNLSTTGSWNVFIANQGQGGDNAVIRIGDTNQTKTYISGIHGVTTGGAAVAVMVDANGQLGTASSSRSTKQDIQDIGDTTQTIMNLHPVRFHYKAWGPDSEMQYGLIAEDVAEVAPDLVARRPNGDIMTVYYDKVNAMVLNQVQEQQRLIDKQNALIQQLESRISDLESRGK